MPDKKQFKRFKNRKDTVSGRTYFRNAPTHKRRTISTSSRTRQVSDTASYKNLLYGALAVVILFAIFLLGIKILAPKLNNSGSITPEAAKTSVALEKKEATPSGVMVTKPIIAQVTITPTIIVAPTSQPIARVENNSHKQSQQVYTVQSGDSLWSISEKFYQTGYNWKLIAQANNLSNPGAVFSGNKLIIPSITPTQSNLAQNNEQNVPPATKGGTIQNNSPNSVPPANTITGTDYIVQHGDNLWNIAVRAYNDGYKWVDIARANNLSNPGLIFSGNDLKIPR